MARAKSKKKFKVLESPKNEEEEREATVPSKGKAKKSKGTSFKVVAEEPVEEEKPKMPSTLIEPEIPKRKPQDKERKQSTEELKITMDYPKGATGNWQERFEAILNDILSRLERMENNYNALSDEISELREHVNEVETNIHELTALYDAISAQYNPFIDLTPQERRVIGGGALVEEESEGEVIEEELTPEGEEVIVESELKEAPGEELTAAEELDEFSIMTQVQPKRERVSKESYILPEIPDNSVSHMMAIKWTEFMLEKVGPGNIRKLLEYYGNLRWISDEVVSKILHQVMGLNTENIEAEYDTWKMNTDDHMKTLVFLEKIKGGDVGTIHAEEVQDWADDIKRR